VKEGLSSIGIVPRRTATIRSLLVDMLGPKGRGGKPKAGRFKTPDDL
jgi:hypothetical protein